VLLVPPKDKEPIKLETKARTPIPNWIEPERPPAALHAAAENWKERRPHAFLRSLTSTYNCIGLVVASRRAWVDPADLLQILKDDGYRKLSGAAEAMEGDVVVYREVGGRGAVTHAGLILKKQPITEPGADFLVVLSKWGQDGEYLHDESHVPEPYGKPAEYWTERRMVQP